MLRKRLNVPTKSPDQIRQEWEKVKQLDAKNRFKAMKPIANAICDAYQKSTTTIEQLEFYTEVLKQVIRVHDYSRGTRQLAKMISDWLELTGNDKAEITKKKSGKIAVETTIAISDVHYSRDIMEMYDNYSEANLLRVVNAGKAFIFHAVVHKICNVQVRVVDAPEPVLTSKEFKCVIANTETAVIDLPTGVLSVASPWNLVEEEERLAITLTPGRYKVCVYHFYIRNKIDSYYIVLCKTTLPAHNSLTRIYEMHND